jgi:hypothetical protein
VAGARSQFKLRRATRLWATCLPVEQKTWKAQRGCALHLLDRFAQPSVMAGDGKSGHGKTERYHAARHHTGRGTGNGELVGTLGELDGTGRGGKCDVHLHCPCGHHVFIKIDELLVRFPKDLPMQRFVERAACSHCGRRRPTLTLQPRTQEYQPRHGNGPHVKAWS